MCLPPAELWTLTQLRGAHILLIHCSGPGSLSEKTCRCARRLQWRMQRGARLRHVRNYAIIFFMERRASEEILRRSNAQHDVSLDRPFRCLQKCVHDEHILLIFCGGPRRFYFIFRWFFSFHFVVVASAPCMPRRAMPKITHCLFYLLSALACACLSFPGGTRAARIRHRHAPEAHQLAGGQLLLGRDGG